MCCIITNIIEEKKVTWLGTTKKDLMNLPTEVRGELGHHLYLAQINLVSINTSPLKDFSPTVFEIKERFDTNTYRLMYIAKFEESIYVLHVFMKKSHSGSKMDQRDENLIDARLREAQERHNKWKNQK